ncbi:MAG: hypothetical protein ACXVEE_24700 [Polyangiales bacterium]
MDPVRRRLMELQSPGAKLGKREQAELEALLGAHWTTLVAPLAPALSDAGLVFEGGHLSRAVLGPEGSSPDEGGSSSARLPKEHEAAIGSPAWSTVRALHVQARDDEAARILVHPAMRELRELTNVGTKLAVQLATAPFAYRLERLGLYVYAGDTYDAAALARAAAFPELRELSIFFFSDVGLAELPWLANSELFGRLRVLRIEGAIEDRNARDEVGGFASIARDTSIERLEFTGPTGFQLAFLREGGALSVLRVGFRGKQKLKLATLLEALASLPDDFPLRTIELEVPLAKADLEKVDRAASRFSTYRGRRTSEPQKKPVAPKPIRAAGARDAAWSKLGEDVAAARPTWRAELEALVARLANGPLPYENFPEVKCLVEVRPALERIALVALAVSGEAAREEALLLRPIFDRAFGDRSFASAAREKLVSLIWLELLATTGPLEEAHAFKLRFCGHDITKTGTARHVPMEDEPTLGFIAAARGDAATVPYFLDKKPLLARVDPKAKFGGDIDKVARHVASAINRNTGFPSVERAFADLVAKAPAFMKAQSIPFLQSKASYAFAPWDLILLARAVTEHVAKRRADETIAMLRDCARTA